METKQITLRNLDALIHRPFQWWSDYARRCRKDQKTREKVMLVFCSCGSKENPAGINSNHEALDKAGVKNVAYVSPDTAHEFLTWRRSFYQFAPLLFR
ncbi:MAG: hypothetical protein U0930_07390 [Pirellulales bacterium]